MSILSNCFKKARENNVTFVREGNVKLEKFSELIGEEFLLPIRELNVTSRIDAESNAYKMLKIPMNDSLQPDISKIDVGTATKIDKYVQIEYIIECAPILSEKETLKESGCKNVYEVIDLMFSEEDINNVAGEILKLSRIGNREQVEEIKN